MAFAFLGRFLSGVRTAATGFAARFRGGKAASAGAVARRAATGGAGRQVFNDPQEFMSALVNAAKSRGESDTSRFATAAWGIESVSNRLAHSLPSFAETIEIKVYGQRWATVEDLYILAMCILVDLVDGHNWVGAQGIRCLIDRTGKYVEVEFNQAKQGLVDYAVTMTANGHPAYFFHQPDWLSNEIKIPSKNRVRQRVPDVLGSVADIGDELDAAIPRDDLIAKGRYTANRVANQTAAASADGIRLVTHEREVNPAPIADGMSRGTDLTALIAQALHESCDPPPVPETDRQYHLDDPPEWGGCNWPVRVDGPEIHRRFRDWWLGFLRAGRWMLGWRWAVGRPGPAGGLVVDPARPNERTPC